MKTVQQWINESGNPITVWDIYILPGSEQEKRCAQFLRDQGLKKPIGLACNGCGTELVGSDAIYNCPGCGCTGYIPAGYKDPTA